LYPEQLPPLVCESLGKTVAQLGVDWMVAVVQGVSVVHNMAAAFQVDPGPLWICLEGVDLSMNQAGGLELSEDFARSLFHLIQRRGGHALISSRRPFFSEMDIAFVLLLGVETLDTAVHASQNKAMDGISDSANG